MSLSNLQGISGGGGVINSLPYFRATKASGSVIYGNDSFSNYDTAIVSGCGTFNAATGVFTPSITGLYQLSAVFSFNAGGFSDNDILYGIYQNYPTGCRVQCIIEGYVGGPMHPTASGLGRLVAGVPVSVLIFQSMATPLPFTLLEFSGCLIASE
jgi:hypothetical protein